MILIFVELFLYLERVRRLNADAHLTTQVVDTPGGGRWTTAKIVICTECNFSWRSRTSANAVNSYHESNLEKSKKRKELKEHKKAIELERLSKIEDSSEASDL